MAALTISIHLLASMLCIEAGSGSIGVNYSHIANNLPSQPTRIPPSNLLHQFVEAAAKPQGSRQTASLTSPWNPEEDELLQQLVQKHGPRNWSLISKSIPGRSGKSCRLRWCKQLSPQVEHCAFTPDEDDTIIRAHTKFGNKWATIARLRHLPVGKCRCLAHQGRECRRPIRISSSSGGVPHIWLFDWCAGYLTKSYSFFRVRQTPVPPAEETEKGLYFLSNLDLLSSKSPTTSFTCSCARDSGDNESKTILDAFFLGKAVAETLNERVESVVGEFLSTIGRLKPSYC